MQAITMAPKNTPKPATPSRSRALAAAGGAKDRCPPTATREQIATHASAKMPIDGPSPNNNNNHVSSEPVKNAAFKPYQLLMEHEITIEYGKNLEFKRVLHEELLCCHSTLMSERFHTAKMMRGAYEKADQMRKELKAFTSPRMSVAAIEEQELENKVAQIIGHIYGNYLPAYLTAIQKLVDDAVDDQVGKRNVVDKTFGKRDIKDMNVHACLEGLNAKGLFAISELLSARLRQIKLREAEVAKTNPVRAAIQRRIILSNVEEKAVRSLINWLYLQGQLAIDDNEHLYALQVLADQLGVKELAEKCLSRLANEAAETIRSALSQGITLQTLLGFDAVEDAAQLIAFGLAAKNVAEVVFHHVLKDKQAPHRLRNLVVETLAAHLDSDLFDLLVDITSGDMATDIIKAMLRVRPAIKLEPTEVKNESKPAANDGPLHTDGT